MNGISVALMIERLLEEIECAFDGIEWIDMSVISSVICVPNLLHKMNPAMHLGICTFCTINFSRAINIMRKVVILQVLEERSWRTMCDFHDFGLT